MHESLILVPNIDQMYKDEDNSNRKPCLLLKSETNTKTETNFRILPTYYLFWHKKCYGRSETHIFFFWPYKHLNHKYFFFIMIYFGKKWDVLVKSGGVLVVVYFDLLPWVSVKTVIVVIKKLLAYI